MLSFVPRPMPDYAPMLNFLLSIVSHNAYFGTKTFCITGTHITSIAKNNFSIEFLQKTLGKGLRSSRRTISLHDLGVGPSIFKVKVKATCHAANSGKITSRNKSETGFYLDIIILSLSKG